MYKKGAGKKSISRNYQNINCSGSEADWNYKSKVVDWGSIEDYTLGKKLGEGTFSEVFKGVHKKLEANVAIKRVIKGSPEKIKREVSILKRIKGSKNNAHIFDSVQGNSGSEKYIVINYYVDDRLIKNNTPISEAEVKEYMFQLLNGLDEAHSRGVIHRDIKPANVVINRKRSRLKIIDWGMADFYHPYSEYPITVSSYHYRAPELLLGMKQYDYSLDMWSFACIFAGLVCNSFPFVKGRDKSNVELLRNISGLLGENEFWNYIEKYNLDGVSKEILGAIVNPSEESRLVLMRSDSALKSNLALDLISKVLKVDHQERLTAREAMEHPYFDEVRKA